MTEPELLNLIAEADRAATAAQAANDALCAALLGALRHLVPVGTIIDLDARDKARTYLWQLKTLAGKDHGARKFRVEHVRSVDVSPRHPTLTKWSCDAVPISGKTGKDMKASAGNRGATKRTTVRLSGYIAADRWDLDGGGQEAELKQLVKTFADN